MLVKQNRSLLGLLFYFICSSVFAQIEFVLDENLSFKSELQSQKKNNVHELTLNVELPSLQIFPSEEKESFVEFGHEKLQFFQKPGAPKVPYVSFFVAAYPEDLNLSITKTESHDLENSILAPAQKEPCRCEDDKKLKDIFLFNKNEYTLNSKLVTTEYLGSFRGTPITRITVKLAKSDLATKRVKVFSILQLKIRSPQHLETNIYKTFNQNTNAAELDILVVGQKSLTNGLASWKNRKEVQGYKIKVINVEGVDVLSAKVLGEIFKQEYKKNKYRYALLVGDATKIGTNLVKTQWSDQTQSDYGFFLMDGKRDIIPDVHYGRIVASSESEVEYQANKWMNYELEQTLQNRVRSMIGIASNEGANPSDDEYVKSIEKMLKTKYGTNIEHFYQNDQRSNPKDINNAFNDGAQWLTYMGHGDGKSWGSTNQTYSVDHIKNLKNSKVVQPILIDVACQNGQLNKGHFGERMVNEGQKKNYFWRENNSLGAALYYGGSVNISWHPPAIMAKGMIEEQINQNLNNIGDIILAGHLYLMKNYSDLNAVKENFSWYHLFGDPSTQVRF
jgi:hypothetical protein